MGQQGEGVAGLVVGSAEGGAPWWLLPPPSAPTVAGRRRRRCRGPLERGPASPDAAGTLFWLNEAGTPLCALAKSLGGNEMGAGPSSLKAVTQAVPIAMVSSTPSMAVGSRKDIVCVGGWHAPASSGRPLRLRCKPEGCSH